MENAHKLDFVISAPGKVILFGEHSVVYKKAAVSTAISRRLYVNVSTGQLNTFCIKLPKLNKEFVWNLNDLKEVLKVKCPLKDANSIYSIGNPDAIDYGIYIASLKENIKTMQNSTEDLSDKCMAALLGILFVFRGILNNLSDYLLPLTITIKSDLEVGAGTGSSAAFAVAIAGSVLKLREYLDPESNNMKMNQHLIDTSNASKSKFNFSREELNIINKWAFCIEKIMHGHPSGIDNTTCLFGSVVVASEGINGSGDLEFTLLENIPKLSILLLSTGVSRNTLSLLMKVRSLRDSNFAAVEAILNAMDVIALEAVNVLRAMSSTLCHETLNVELYNVLGSLMELNHGLLRTLGVSHESLERIVSLTKTFGFSSKLTGAGGGGNAITLLPPSCVRSHVQSLIGELGPPFTGTEINIAEEGIRIEKV